MLVFEAPGSLWITVGMTALWFVSFNVPAVYIARTFHLRLWWLAAVPHLESTILVPLGYRKPVVILYWAVPVLSLTVLLVLLLVGVDWERRTSWTVVAFPLIWQYFAWAGVCLKLGESRFYAFVASTWPISIFGTWHIAAATWDQAAEGTLHGVPRTAG